MLEIGKYYILEIIKKVDFGVYLDFDGEEILLPKKYTPEDADIGNKLRVFVHKDSMDRLLATTQEPKGQLGDFVALKVTDANAYGAFLDWGLEKELFVPFKEQKVKMKAGETHVVKICLDNKTDRLLGVSKLNVFFAQDLSGISEGDEVSLLVHTITPMGVQAVIEQKYNGLIYKDELFTQIKIGDQLTGSIKKIRDDGKIDLTLRRGILEVIDTAKESILNALSLSDGFLPFHDKSKPEDIRQHFNMSKKDFKKAIGALYREERLLIGPDGITLKTK